MASQLSSDQLAQITPLLGSLARLIARDTTLSDDQLELLIEASDLPENPAAQSELRRWAHLLQRVASTSNEKVRHAVVEALLLRGLPEATVLLAVETIAGRGETPPTIPEARPLVVQPARLEWTMQGGQAAVGELEIQGGPGQVVVESDHVQVTPQQFGPEPTQLHVSVRPLSEGMVWTSIKLLTADQTRDIPVVAQWLSPKSTIAGAAPITGPSPSSPEPFHAPPVERLSSLPTESEVAVPTTHVSTPKQTGNLSPRPSVVTLSGTTAKPATGTSLSAPAPSVASNHQTNQKLAQRRFLAWWFVAAALGVSVAWLVGLEIQRGFITIIPAYPSVLSWLVIGFITGLITWWVLYRYLQISLRWILASTLGSGLASVINDQISLHYDGYFSSLALILIYFSMIGLACGFLQWLVLRSKIKRALWWILISVVAYGSLDGIFLLAPSVMSSGVTIISAVIGLLYAIITTLGFRLLRSKTQASGQSTL
jgi:hypothetical protein